MAVPPGAYPNAAPPPGFGGIDPVTAAYLEEYEKEQAKERREGKREVPDFVKEMPEYKAARGQKIAGLVLVPVGGGATFGGLIWLAVASLKGCGFLQSCTPDRGGQAGGGALLGIGLLSMGIGGVLLGTARSEMRKIENKYAGPGVSELRVNVGVGSLSVSVSF